MKNRKLRNALYAIIFGKKGPAGFRYRLYYYFRGTKHGEDAVYDTKAGMRNGLHKDKKFVVLPQYRKHAGICSNINCWLSELKRWKEKDPERIPIIIPEVLENHIFEPFSQYSLQEVEKSQNVMKAGANSKDVVKYRADLTNVLTSDRCLKEYNALFHQYFHFTGVVENHFQREYNRTIKEVLQQNKKVLGVKFRQSDYVYFNVRDHAIQPPMEEMANYVADFMEQHGYEYLFLAVEEKRSRDYFVTRFGDKLLYCDNNLADYDSAFSDRAYYSFTEIAAKQKGRIEAEEDYIVEVLLLAQCDALLATKTSGTYVAVILNNGKYEMRKIIDWGVHEKESQNYKKLTAYRNANGW